MISKENYCFVKLAFSALFNCMYGSMVIMFKGKDLNNFKILFEVQVSSIQTGGSDVPLDPAVSTRTGVLPSLQHYSRRCFVHHGVLQQEREGKKVLIPLDTEIDHITFWP